MVDIEKVKAEALKIYHDEDWFPNEVAMIWRSRLGPLLAAIEQSQQETLQRQREIGVFQTANFMAKAGLSDHEQQVLKMRYENQYGRPTLRQCSESFDMDISRLHHIEQSGLRKLVLHYLAFSPKDGE